VEVNVAINIKVETLFQGRMYFVRGAEISTRGEEIFPPPGDFVMGRLYFVIS